jgi:hypothetical protein
MREHGVWRALVVGVLIGPPIALLLASAWDQYSGRSVAFARGEVEERSAWFIVAVALCGVLLASVAALALRLQELPRYLEGAAWGAWAAMVLVFTELLLTKLFLGPGLLSGWVDIGLLYGIPIASLIGGLFGMLMTVGDADS